MAIRDFFDYQADDGGDDPPDGGIPALGAEWSPERWSRLLGHTELLHVHPGEHLIRLGEASHALHIVDSGELEVRLPGRRRGTTILLGPGALIGEISFFDGQPATADVVARTDAQVRRLSAAQVDRLSARDPELARALLVEVGRILAARLRQAQDVTPA